MTPDQTMPTTPTLPSIESTEEEIARLSAGLLDHLTVDADALELCSEAAPIPDLMIDYLDCAGGGPVG